MKAYWVWWLTAVLLVIAEMLSGTFYLLAVASGFAVAGLALTLVWRGAGKPHWRHCFVRRMWQDFSLETAAHQSA